MLATWPFPSKPRLPFCPELADVAVRDSRRDGAGSDVRAAGPPPWPHQCPGHRRLHPHDRGQHEVPVHAVQLLHPQPGTAQILLPQRGGIAVLRVQDLQVWHLFPQHCCLY